MQISDAQFVRMHLGSKYGVCFRACMDRLMHVLFSTNKHHRLNVVLEEDIHRSPGFGLNLRRRLR